jgi:hypothetical protein
LATLARCKVLASCAHSTSAAHLTWTPPQVAYTFLYWLPYYISTTEVGGRSLTPTEAGNLSILFDVGGVLGGAVAGYLSDVSGASALVSFGFVFSAIPFLYLYRVFGELSFAGEWLKTGVRSVFRNAVRGSCASFPAGASCWESPELACLSHQRHNLQHLPNWATVVSSPQLRRADDGRRLLIPLDCVLDMFTVPPPFPRSQHWADYGRRLLNPLD